MSWNPGSEIQQMFSFHFMQNAFEVGTLIALLAGAAGYFVALRGQSFVAHSLSQIGFPGAAAATLLHAPALAGLLVFCIAGAGGMSLAGTSVEARGRSESALVGTILAFALGLGFLFFHLYAGSAVTMYSVLFGTVLGVSDEDVYLALSVTAISLGILVTLARPLLFTSADPAVAAARGLSVRGISIAFLVVVALAVAAAVQVVGTLLIFALLVTPGAAALALTPRPWFGLCLSVAFALIFTWAGLTAAYFTDLPVGFLITTIAFGTYLLARAARAVS